MELTYKIWRDIFEVLYKYTMEHKDDPDPVILMPGSLRDGLIKKHGISLEQYYEIDEAFSDVFTGKSYRNPLDILKDHPEHEHFIMSHVFGPDYKSLTEEEKQQILKR